MLSVGAAALYHNATGGSYGNDFRGILAAAHRIAHGASPYLGSTAHQLGLANNPYVLPPLIAELAIPLTGLPFAASVAIFNVACALALIAALRILGTRDARVYAVALCSLPFVSSVFLGQPDGLFALLLALAWRWRSSWRAGVVLALLIAAKPLLLPLVVWPVLTRRWAGAALAAAGSALLLLASWAPIGFTGLLGYPHRLALDGRAFDGRSHSLAAALLKLGTSLGTGELAGLLVALLAAALLARWARDRDLGAFTACMAGALLASPLLWTHYLTILFVPLALTRRRLDLVWMSVALFYLSPREPVAHVWQIAVVLALGLAMAAGAVVRARELKPRSAPAQRPL